MKKNKIFIFGFLVITVLFTFVVLTTLQNNNNNPNFESTSAKKAAIIDQLNDDKPNLNYQNTITQHLEQNGFEVDLYTTEMITVDFYKKLPTLNYQFIIIRSHALGAGTVEDSESLFTGEIYNDEEYLVEQFYGRVAKGVPYLPDQVNEMGGLETLANETYFVIGSKLIDEAMEGSFPNSVIILGGCETTDRKILAESLLAKGASKVVGWNGLVSAGDNDKVIMELVGETLVNGTTIEDSVRKIMEKYEGKLRTSAKLEYHSSGAIGSNFPEKEN